MSAKSALAAVMVSPRETELRDIPLPDVPADGGLLKVSATGICGSDWPRYLSERFAPGILGHEIVGHIEKLGSAARARWGVEEGDYVAIEDCLPCGHCAFCRAGDYRACPDTGIDAEGAIRYGATRLTVAPALYGGYSQYLYLHPRAILHRVPEGVPPEIAALAIPLGNAFQWARFDGGAGPGKTVIVLGPGVQGLACAVAAAASGASQIVVAGLARHRPQLELARSLGATHTLVIDDMDARAMIADITGGAMADTIIDVSNAGPEIVNGALMLLGRRGRLLCTALKKSAVPFDLDRLVRNQMQLLGARGRSYEAVALALRLMTSHAYPLHLLCSRSIGLNDVDRGLKIAGGETADPAIRMTVTPWM